MAEVDTQSHFCYPNFLQLMSCSRIVEGQLSSLILSHVSQLKMPYLEGKINIQIQKVFFFFLNELIYYYYYMIYVLLTIDFDFTNRKTEKRSIKTT